MRWFKAHAGISTDNKFLLISRRTGHDGARIAGVWLALLDHACASTPRGSIETFDAEGYAAWAGMEQAEVERLVTAMGPKSEGGVGLHDGEFLTSWKRRQGKDPTGAARQKRYRERQAAAANDTTSNARNVTRTPRHAQEREIEQSSSSHTSSSAVSSSSSDTSCDDAGACALAMSAGEVWQALELAGVPTGFIARTKASNQVRRWIADGLTREQFDDAVSRAMQSRHDAGTPDVPLNVGFLNSVITNPIGQRKRQAAKSYEVGDEISERFARG